MTHSKQTLTPAEIDAAGLTDWRLLLGTLNARYRTGDFATGLALVNRIGALAEAADHHPDLTLGYPEVRVALSSHDVGGITSRDLALADQISAAARDLGATPQPHRQTVVELGLDTADAARLGPFYAALLDAEARGEDAVADPSGQATALWFQTPSGGGSALPDADPPQRWHLDVWMPRSDIERRLEAVLAAGGRLVSDAEAPSFWVVEDPDGNRSCLCTHETL